MKAPKSDRARRILSDKKASKELVSAARHKGSNGSVHLGSKKYQVKSAPKYVPSKRPVAED